MTKKDAIRMALEVGAKPSNNPEKWDIFEISDESLERFAEFVVKECLQKLENDGMVEVAMEMKQHFGVAK